jgi:hypothetical protein
MDKAVQSAPVGKRVHYERRRPEDPGWYKNTSRASLSKPSVRPGRDGPILPKRRSSRPFFNVAVRPQGFVRLRYADCIQEKLVAFPARTGLSNYISSVKKQGRHVLSVLRTIFAGQPLSLAIQG